MPSGHSTHKLFVGLCSQQVKVLSPQHSVGKQAGQGHGREGGSWLWPLYTQGDHSNGQRREPGPCKVERKVLRVLGGCAEEEVAPGNSFPACSARAGSMLTFCGALLDTGWGQPSPKSRETLSLDLPSGLGLLPVQPAASSWLELWLLHEN